jgi:hypothetical protein
LGVDIEGYGAGRDNPDQLAMRDGLYRCLHSAFEKSGISWEACYHEDRGDGVLVLIPPEIPKGSLVIPLLQELAAALRLYNEGRDVGARIRIRLVLHAGEVHRERFRLSPTY